LIGNPATKVAKRHGSDLCLELLGLLYLGRAARQGERSIAENWYHLWTTVYPALEGSTGRIMTSKPSIT
jgi:hypothetical protein